MPAPKLIRYIRFLNPIPILLGNSSTVTYLNCDKAEHKGFLIVADRNNKEVIVRDRQGYKWHVPYDGVAVMRYVSEDQDIDQFLDDAAAKLLNPKFTVTEMMEKQAGCEPGEVRHMSEPKPTMTHRVKKGRLTKQQRSGPFVEAVENDL